MYAAVRVHHLHARPARQAPSVPPTAARQPPTLTRQAPRRRAASRPCLPRRPARRDHHGPVGRRQDRRQQAVRGPRLHGRGQRAPRAAARPGGARGQRPGALSSASRSCWTSAPATRRSPSAPRWAPSTAATSSPRSSSSRRATRSLIRRYQRDPPPPPARHRRPRASRPPSRASGRCSTRSAAMAQVIIDTSDLSQPPAAGAHPGALETRPRARPDRAPGHQLRLQVRRAAGGGPGLRRALHGEPVLRARAARARPGLTEPVRDVRPGPAGHGAVPRASCTSSSRSPSRPTRRRARPG